jgi:arylesterase / paraoxonase
MKRWLVWTLAVIGLAAITVGIQVFYFLERNGQFTQLVEVKPPGGCHVALSPPGIEDLALDRARGLGFLSSDDRRAAAAGQPRDGAIFAAILDDLDAGAFVRLTGADKGTPTPFHPHGISLWTAPDGTRTLFVVNHPEGGVFGQDRPGSHTVEIFDVEEAPAGQFVEAPVVLKHRRTVTSPLFTWPNDVAATGPDSFYVTNSLGSETALGIFAETFWGLERSNVVFFDGKEARAAATGLGFANGIALSADGKTLYTTETTGRRLRAYARDSATGALTLANEGFFGTGLDNIDVAPDGALWIGSHPRMVDFLSHARDAKHPSPSQILRVEPQEKGAARTVYLADGRELSGISAAAEYRGKVIAGSVFEPKLLICELEAGVKSAGVK